MPNPTRLADKAGLERWLKLEEGFWAWLFRSRARVARRNIRLLCYEHPADVPLPRVR
jgi:hypothetical protein